MEEYKQFLRDRGEKLELSEVWPPPVPTESNSLTAVQDAFGMNGSGEYRDSTGNADGGTGQGIDRGEQPDARNSDFTNSWEGFAADMEADLPAIELLHQVLERPKLDFSIELQTGREVATATISEHEAGHPKN